MFMQAPPQPDLSPRGHLQRGGLRCEAVDVEVAAAKPGGGGKVADVEACSRVLVCGRVFSGRCNVLFLLPGADAGSKQEWEATNPRSEGAVQGCPWTGQF